MQVLGCSTQTGLKGAEGIVAMADEIHNACAGSVSKVESSSPPPPDAQVRYGWNGFHEPRASVLHPTGR
jgi:hypothetical protein